jgi:hypothetical protein
MNIMHCWRLGEQGEREWTSNGEEDVVNMIKAWHIDTDLKYQGETPSDYRYTFKKMKGKREK